jgi:hypothetical protein
LRTTQDINKIKELFGRHKTGPFALIKESYYDKTEWSGFIEDGYGELRLVFSGVIDFEHGRELTTIKEFSELPDHIRAKFHFELYGCSENTWMSQFREPEIETRNYSLTFEIRNNPEDKNPETYTRHVSGSNTYALIDSEYELMRSGNAGKLINLISVSSEPTQELPF